MRPVGGVERDGVAGGFHPFDRVGFDEPDAPAGLHHEPGDRLLSGRRGEAPLQHPDREASRAAQACYLAPLREEVEGLLGRFFDAEESTVAFDEDLALEKLSRSTDGSFHFDPFSAGARQQLGLLIRRAMARLVGLKKGR